MTTTDWVIIAIYLAGMIGLSIFWGRNQKNSDDYYVGGRNLPWWALGISTMATQSSAISFISIPAFVALKTGGGLSWLQYELAVPLAMILVMAFLIPFFRKLKLITVYEYLEMRFGKETRYFLSLVFLISRGFATGMGIYATAVVLAVCLEVPISFTILVIGIVTVVYDTIGGMKAVVYSDVIQMFILIFGLGACIYYTMDAVGGWANMVGSLDPARYQTLNLTHGIGDGSQAPFWSFLFGGLFLYASYYGVDQSQAQRALSSPTMNDSKKALLFNGVARFPLTLMYLSLGVAAGAAYYYIPELQSSVPPAHLDYLVPKLIIHVLPTGLRAILLAALLAAAMSSADSSLNSLSAVTVRDFIQRGRQFSPHQTLVISKITTIIWGAAITFLAFFAHLISETVVEGINKIGSAFYGPILASFMLGVLSKRVNGIGVNVGVLAGVAFNMSLWVTGVDIFWMWWNTFGFFVSIAVAYAVSFLSEAPSREKIQLYTLQGSGTLALERKWIPVYALLVAYFGVILAACIFLSQFAR